jgi:hypothetical protein
MEINLAELPVIYQCLLIVACNLAYATARTINIGHAVKGTILQNVISNGGLVAVWFISLSLGLRAALDGEFVILLVYLVSSAVGPIPLLIKQKRPWY